MISIVSFKKQLFINILWPHHLLEYPAYDTLFKIQQLNHIKKFNFRNITKVTRKNEEIILTAERYYYLQLISCFSIYSLFSSIFNLPQISPTTFNHPTKLRNEKFLSLSQKTIIKTLSKNSQIWDKEISFN